MTLMRRHGRIRAVLRAMLRSLGGASTAVMLGLSLGSGVPMPYHDMPYQDGPREPRGEWTADPDMNRRRGRARANRSRAHDSPAPLSAAEQRDWTDLLNRLA